METWVDFKAVKAVVTIQAVLDRYGINWLRKKGDELRGRCPIHKGEGTDTFHCEREQECISLLQLQEARQRFRLRGGDGELRCSGCCNKTGGLVFGREYSGKRGVGESRRQRFLFSRHQRREHHQR